MEQHGDSRGARPDRHRRPYRLRRLHIVAPGDCDDPSDLVLRLGGTSRTGRAARTRAARIRSRLARSSSRCSSSNNRDPARLMSVGTLRRHPTVQGGSHRPDPVPSAAAGQLVPALAGHRLPGYKPFGQHRAVDREREDAAVLLRHRASGHPENRPYRLWPVQATITGCSSRRLWPSRSRSSVCSLKEANVVRPPQIPTMTKARCPMTR